MSKTKTTSKGKVFKVGGHLSTGDEFFAGDPVPSNLLKIDLDALEEMGAICTKEEFDSEE